MKFVVPPVGMSSLQLLLYNPLHLRRFLPLLLPLRRLPPSRCCSSPGQCLDLRGVGGPLGHKVPGAEFPCHRGGKLSNSSHRSPLIFSSLLNTYLCYIRLSARPYSLTLILSRAFAVKHCIYTYSFLSESHKIQSSPSQPHSARGTKQR
jgi:hypothetical protein